MITCIFHNELKKIRDKLRRFQRQVTTPKTGIFCFEPPKCHRALYVATNEPSSTIITYISGQVGWNPEK